MKLMHYTENNIASNEESQKDKRTFYIENAILFLVMFLICSLVITAIVSIGTIPFTYHIDNLFEDERYYYEWNEPIQTKTSENCIELGNNFKLSSDLKRLYIYTSQDSKLNVHEYRLDSIEESSTNKLVIFDKEFSKRGELNKKSLSSYALHRAPILKIYNIEKLQKEIDSIARTVSKSYMKQSHTLYLTKEQLDRVASIIE